MEPYEPHLALATAVAVGFLVGLEREQAASKPSAFAGVRTYPIVALIGSVATLLAPALPWLPLVALGSVGVLLAISYADDVRNGRDHGVTTEASVIATYLLGALATSRHVIEPLSDRLLLVAILGVTMTFLLSSKQLLHGIASRVSREDFYATVKFLIVAVVVLPLLPRRDLGPLGSINPFNVGLMVVTIAGLSFVGYVAMRLLGTGRGIVLGAAAGGLVSSTGVTVAMAGRTKQQPALAPAAAGAIAIASGIMLCRVAVVVSLIDVSLLPRIAVPLAGALVGAAIGGLVVYRRVADAHTPITVKNPFELGNAIRFGLVFGAILVATRTADHYLGSKGLYLAAALGGTTDVDAVTLSSAKLAASGTDANTVIIAILLAVAVNTLVKSALALALGGRALGVRAFVVGVLIITGCAAGLATSYALF